MSHASVDKGLRLLGAALSPRLTLPAARFISSWPAALLEPLEPALLERLTRPAACCPDGGVHYRFVSRYVDLVERPAALAWIKRVLAAQGPERAPLLLESYWRMVTIGMLRHELLARRRAGAPALLEVQLAPYPGCTLSCRGCSSAGDLAGPEPTRRWLAQLVDQAARAGAWVVHVVGKGEPFLTERRAERLLEVVAARPELMFSIATNGLLLTEALARRLARLGNVLLLVSVDGPAAAHDARRGAGTAAQVRATLERLRRHRLLFGYAAMVSEESALAVTAPAFLEEMASAGCAIGVYSRYYPPPAAPLWPEGEALRLTPATLARYREALARARAAGVMSVLDFDDVEEQTGCRSRGGVSVYVDGVTGRVAPCVRLPFTAPGCRLTPGGPGLAEVLEHPFFRRYRRGDEPWGCCGADLGAEAEALRGDLAACGAVDQRLERYRTLLARAPGEGRASEVSR